MLFILLFWLNIILIVSSVHTLVKCIIHYLSFLLVVSQIFLVLVVCGWWQDCRYSRHLAQPSVSVSMLPLHILDWYLPQCYCYKWSYEGQFSGKWSVVPSTRSNLGSFMKMPFVWAYEHHSWLLEGWLKFWLEPSWAFIWRTLFYLKRVMLRVCLSCVQLVLFRNLYIVGVL